MRSIYGADGLLSVSAKEQTTGIESHVVVKPSYGLTDKEIERMLRDSITHAREDESVRKLRERQVEAERLLAAVSAALAVDGTLLDAQERAAIDVCLRDLKTARDGSDAAAIKQSIETLDRATQTFAQRRMDINLHKALAGHRLDEFSAAAETKGNL